MHSIDLDIQRLYIMILKYNMRVRDIPVAWRSVQATQKNMDPEYVYCVPGYIKTIMKYGKELNGQRQ